MSNEHFVENPPENLAGWRKVWTERLSYRSRVFPSLFRWIEQTFGALLRPQLNRQRDYNIVVADLLRDLQTDVRDLRRDLTDSLADVRRELAIVPVASRRGDALIAAIDRKLETLSARVRDLTLPAITTAQAAPSFRDDFVYRRLEDALRGSSAEVRAAVDYYAELAAPLGSAIDLGCGRGEFLDACRERSVAARGYDTNELSIAELQRRGLDVAAGAIPGCLDAHDADSVGSIFASHVVEHLPFAPLVGLFAAARRVLKPGGLLMLETPNAETLRMAASDIWRDPTHLAPRHAAALVTIAREYGFSVVELAPIHPYPASHHLRLAENQPDDLQQLVDRLNDLLFGGQDLRAIFRKEQ